MLDLAEPFERDGKMWCLVAHDERAGYFTASVHSSRDGWMACHTVFDAFLDPALRDKIGKQLPPIKPKKVAKVGEREGKEWCVVADRLWWRALDEWAMATYGPRISNAADLAFLTDLFTHQGDVFPD